MVVSGESTPKAPPPPVVVEREVAGPGAAQPASTLYSIGQPTPEEQLFVELINRARADAAAEAQRLAETMDPDSANKDPDVRNAVVDKGTDGSLLADQFSIFEQNLPPLAINADLMRMARLHSEDMLINVFQGHTSSDDPPPPFSSGDILPDRASAVEYGDVSQGDILFLGENAYANGQSVWHAHAAFQIDWGSGPNGYQDPPGHRYNIHSYNDEGTNPNWREIGVGVAIGTNQQGEEAVGPILVTQDFGTRTGAGNLPFLTGVAYLDVDGDNFYDMGEGLGGVEVQVEGATHYAITAESGGYTVPLPGDDSYDVTFSGPNFPTTTETVTISNGENGKVDLVLTFSPPVISGGRQDFILGVSEDFQLPGGDGAEFYEIEELEILADSIFEGGENGTGKVLVGQSGSYDVLQNEKSFTGEWAFHLAQPEVNLSGEVFELDRDLLVLQGAELTFASQLGDATEDQTALVEVLPEGESQWETVWEQAGDLANPEQSFSTRNVDLSDYANQSIRLRFRYLFTSGSYLNGTTVDDGWLLDEISFSSVVEVAESRILTSGDPTFTYTPAGSGQFRLRARAVNGPNLFPWGPAIAVSVGAGIVPWREEWFSAAELADPGLEASLWGDAADPDGDGLVNWLEYALGGNPLLPDNAAVSPEYRKVGDSLEMIFTKVQEGVTYEVRQSPSMEAGSWTTAGVTLTPDPAGAPTGTEIRAEVPVPASGPLLLRLEVPAP